MNAPQVVIVQIDKRAWTFEALHCAGWMARQTGAPIALVKMVPVQHQGWLGSPWGSLAVNRQAQKEVIDYQATLEDYGVAYTLTIFQYADWVEGTAQVARVLRAGMIFAQTPDSRLPGWRKYQTWSLERQLKRLRC
jgi:hypothetical protein